MEIMARNIESGRENINNKEVKVGSPYHISNFIKQLETYNIATNHNSNSHSAHKLNQSRRKLVHEKS